MLLPSKSSLASVQKKVGLLTSDYILFKKYDDKDLSFTDCTSFALMKRLKVQTCVPGVRSLFLIIVLSLGQYTTHCRIVQLQMICNFFLVIAVNFYRFDNKAITKFFIFNDLVRK